MGRSLAKGFMASTVLIVAFGAAVARTEPAAPAQIMIAHDAGADDPGHFAHTFFRVDDEMCRGPIWPRTLLTYGLLFANKRGPVPVAADTRLYIQVNSASGTAQPGRTVTCNNIGSFIPEAGRVYELSQTNSRTGCHFVVVDRATGSLPASYIAHPVVAACRS